VRKKPNGNERRLLWRLQQRGFVLVKPNHRLTKGMQGLIEKGYVRPLPGLFYDTPFYDTPQGYAPAD